MNIKSLRFKISVSIFVTFLLIAAVYSTILYPFELRRREEAAHKIRTLVAAIADRHMEDLANEIFAGQNQAIRYTLHEIAGVEGIVGVEVYDLDGRLLAVAGRAFLSGMEPVERVAFSQSPSYEEGLLQGQPTLSYETVIKVIGEHVGYLRMHYSLARIEQEKTFSIIIFATLLFTILLLMAGILNWFMQRTVIGPLSVLRNAMAGFESSGEKAEGTGDEAETLSVLAAEQGDEIGELAKAFVDMTAKLKQQQEELLSAIRSKEAYSARLKESNEKLEAFNTRLENLVEERTRDLRASEERYRLFFEQDLSGAFICDVGGRLIACNPAFARIFGFDSVEEALEANMVERYPTVEAWHSFVERIRWETKVELLESEHRRKDGRIIHTVQNVAGSFSSDGNLKQFHGYIIDNTAHKELEREMLKTQKIESVGVLAGGIAHDFNNILTGILGNINLASMSIKTPETAADKLQRAEKAALRAKDLTAQLLAFSKGGAPVKQTMSLPALLEETAQFALRGSNVRFDLSVPGGLWAVEADAGQISQVINNLIINADQAMVEGGTIKVSAGNVHVAVPCPLPLHPGNYVRISVEDDGEGIPVEHLPKVFDPYFTTKSDGNGLGLATSFAVVKNHEGHITVDSLPGQGTRFDVFLPASGEKPADEGEPSPDLRGLGERILVMDDQAEVREVASAMLEEMGCTVECAGDGEEAVESYRRALRSGRPFGAVLMDLTIPGGMGGKEAVKRIRELDPGARVIVASGYSNDPVMAEFRNHGFSAVVTKPFRIEELGRTLRSVLNQKSGARLGRAS